MTEFWEKSFRDKQAMWGWESADSAIETLDLFKKYGLNKILIPGFGYGRNAKIFTDNGFNNRIMTPGNYLKTTIASR